jgi:hypothetical protein
MERRLAKCQRVRVELYVCHRYRQLFLSPLYASCKCSACKRRTYTTKRQWVFVSTSPFSYHRGKKKSEGSRANPKCLDLALGLDGAIYQNLGQLEIPNGPARPLIYLIWVDPWSLNFGLRPIGLGPNPGPGRPIPIARYLQHTSRYVQFNMHFL